MILVLTVAICLAASGLWAQVNEFGPAEPYVVKKGDTAAIIAKRFYGKASLGPKLWQANQNLVAHPKRLTVGDTIYLFPESTLMAAKATAVPPPPIEKTKDLYDRGELFRGSFPKYFSFLADGRGLGETGALRIKVKKEVPVEGAGTEGPFRVEEGLFEVRNVGEIMASSEHPGMPYGDGADKAASWGKVMMSTNDEVFVRFTEDVAKILDSETYGDEDPYFREYPIYGVSYNSREGDRSRVDWGNSVGEIYRYKGSLSIVARVEGIAPLTPRDIKALKRRTKAQGQDVEPVTYVARITIAEDAIAINDRVFLFVPLDPGPERSLEPPYVEPPDSYNSLGS
jgi:LysM domain.